MARKIKITINDVWKKHFTIIAWLLGSWVVAFVAAWVLKNSALIGLAPMFNYLGYAIGLELKKSGFNEARKN